MAFADWNRATVQHLTHVWESPVNHIRSSSDICKLNAPFYDMTYVHWRISLTYQRRDILTPIPIRRTLLASRAFLSLFMTSNYPLFLASALPQIFVEKPRSLTHSYPHK
jgi:hypothetical protein